jgi:hypothetical protein
MDFGRAFTAIQRYRNSYVFGYKEEATASMMIVRVLVLVLPQVSVAT